MPRTDHLPAWSDQTGAARTTDLFTAAFGSVPDGVWAAPGRVNLIGEHTDYNAGLSLPIALPHRTYAAVRRRDDDQVRLVSDLDPEHVWTAAAGDLGPGAVGGWVAYPAGVLWALTADGIGVGGVDVAFASCVPLAAGLSSSAAIECALAVAVDDLAGTGLAASDAGRARLAAACVRAENEVAGAPTGGMDQAASLRAAAGHALLLDSRDGSARLVPFDLAAAGLTLLVVDTRAAHALNDGQYAARRATCEDAARRLGVTSLREVTDADAALAALDDDTARHRVRHVVTEIARTAQFAQLVGDGRLRDVGPLMDASHDSLRDDYQVSCDELDVTVDAARAAGALGARMTGGGFGGSAIALVDAQRVDAVADAVLAAYTAHGWPAPGLLTAVASAAAGRVA